MVLGRIYNREKNPSGGQKTQPDQNDRFTRATDSRLAKEFGVGEATVRRAGRLARAVDTPETTDAKQKKEAPG